MSSTSPQAYLRKQPGAPSMPFRLLDLPTELRIMIYDYLITRKHTTITARHPSTTYETCTTLVRSEPVPPIYMTCKLLYAEAGPYLEKKIKNMSTFKDFTENADVEMRNFSKAERQDIVDFLCAGEEFLRNASKDPFSRSSNASETKTCVHFVVAGKWNSGATMDRLLSYIAMICATRQIKGVVHTIDQDLEQIDFVDPRGWISFEGAMDIKKWNKEWA